MLARQARVGILRNPNALPRPPQRRASLMGKWPSLQSTRRPQAQTRAVTADAAPVTDTELARRMKETLEPVELLETAAVSDRPAAPVVTGTPKDTDPPGPPEAEVSSLNDSKKLLILISGFTALIALTVLASVL